MNPTSNPTHPVHLPIERRHQVITLGEGEKCVLINFSELYHLKGKLLTLIDATYSDREQRKAQKDMVWATLRSWLDELFDQNPDVPHHAPPSDA